MRRSALGIACLSMLFVFASPTSQTTKKKSPAAEVKTAAAKLKAAAALAIVPPGCSTGAELVQPDELTPDKTTHVLSTTLDAQWREKVPVPVYTTGGCAMRSFNLRNFAWPGANAGFPGPTLRVRKGADPQHGGDAIKVLLENHLPVLGADTCDQDCKCSDPPKKGDPQCCFVTNASLPNCFHGDNTINLHFHGTHVSPQSPQDYMLLELQPYGSTNGSAHASHGGNGQVAVGSFQYAVNPIPWNQAEGTHWYHPHKHGATALQVVNGMAGAVIIEGPFDDWLESQFPKDSLKEKVMVIQQIHEQNFMQIPTNKFVPTPLINGQLMPQVTMYPGQIQRWRIVSATTEAGAQLTIDFNGPGNVPIQVRQIAMDGIQFAPQNYQKQPLIDPSKLSFQLSPGNRADFLVQAPTTPGIYRATYDVFGAVINQQKERLNQIRGKRITAPTVEDVKGILEAIAPGAAQPGLISINVKACEPGQSCPAMSFPSTLPELPSYLQNLSNPTVPHNVTFSLTTNGTTTGKPGQQPQVFAIAYDGGKPQQFNGDCAAFTAPLGQTQKWTITQNTTNNPFHVYHIHINPFQVVQNGTGKTYDPPIWFDSITLPAQANGPVVMLTKFEDYTGEYVLHCHFLGHEDRGMMLAVQTVCPGTNAYGTPDSSGGPDNCSVTTPGVLQPCSNPPATQAAAKSTTTHEMKKKQ